MIAMTSNYTTNICAYNIILVKNMHENSWTNALSVGSGGSLLNSFWEQK
jgi:hypothetical protein